MPRPPKLPTVLLEVHYPSACTHPGTDAPGWVWQGCYMKRAEAEAAVADLVRWGILHDREHRIRAFSQD